MSGDTTTNLRIVEALAEIQYKRANHGLFEIFNPESREWEEITIWDLRRRELMMWIMLRGIERTLHEQGDVDYMVRVTYNNDLYADDGDELHNVRVDESWTDTEKVAEILDMAWDGMLQSVEGNNNHREDTTP